MDKTPESGKKPGKKQRGNQPPAKKTGKAGGKAQVKGADANLSTGKAQPPLPDNPGAQRSGKGAENIERPSPEASDPSARHGGRHTETIPQETLPRQSDHGGDIPPQARDHTADQQDAPRHEVPDRDADRRGTPAREDNPRDDAMERHQKQSITTQPSSLASRMI